MKGDSEFIVTLTVLDTLNEVNGSSLREITNAYAREGGMDKTTAAARVKLAIARCKSIGYVVESPRGIFSLKGFGNDGNDGNVGNENCDDCEKGIAMAAKRKGKGRKGTGKAKGKRRRKGKGKGITKAMGIAKKSKGIVKKAKSKAKK